MTFIFISSGEGQGKKDGEEESEQKSLGERIQLHKITEAAVASYSSQSTLLFFF